MRRTEGLAAHPIHSPTVVPVLTHTRPPTDTPTALPGQVGAQEGSRASIATPGSVHRFFLLTVFSSGILRKPAEARPVPSLAPVSYTHLTLPTIHVLCRSRWSPYH